MHVLRYLKATVKTGFCYLVQNNLQLTALCDLDWAYCCFLRKLLTGFGIFLGPSLVFWKIKKIIYCIQILY